MYRIVVPVDDDVDRATAQAQHVANLPGETDGITVTVAHAYQDDAKDTDDRLPEDESPGVTSAVQILQEAEILVETREIFSPVSEGILDLVAELGADSIVMSGRKRSPTGKALFGSVSQKVILNSNVPVTVVDDEWTTDSDS